MNASNTLEMFVLDLEAMEENIKSTGDPHGGSNILPGASRHRERMSSFSWETEEMNPFGRNGTDRSAAVQTQSTDYIGVQALPRRSTDRYAPMPTLPPPSSSAAAHAPALLGRDHPVSDPTATAHSISNQIDFAHEHAGVDETEFALLTDALMGLSSQNPRLFGQPSSLNSNASTRRQSESSDRALSWSPPGTRRASTVSSMGAWATEELGAFESGGRSSTDAIVTDTDLYQAYLCDIVNDTEQPRLGTGTKQRVQEPQPRRQSETSLVVQIVSSLPGTRRGSPVVAQPLMQESHNVGLLNDVAVQLMVTEPSVPSSPSESPLGAYPAIDDGGGGELSMLHMLQNLTRDADDYTAGGADEAYPGIDDGVHAGRPQSGLLEFPSSARTSYGGYEGDADSRPGSYVSVDDDYQISRGRSSRRNNASPPCNRSSTALEGTAPAVFRVGTSGASTAIGGNRRSGEQGESELKARVEPRHINHNDGTQEYLLARGGSISSAGRPSYDFVSGGAPDSACDSQYDVGHADVHGESSVDIHNRLLRRRLQNNRGSTRNNSYNENDYLQPHSPVTYDVAGREGLNGDHSGSGVVYTVAAAVGETEYQLARGSVSSVRGSTASYLVYDDADPLSAEYQLARGSMRSTVGVNEPKHRSTDHQNDRPNDPFRDQRVHVPAGKFSRGYHRAAVYKCKAEHRQPALQQSGHTEYVLAAAEQQQQPRPARPSSYQQPLTETEGSDLEAFPNALPWQEQAEVFLTSETEEIGTHPYISVGTAAVSTAATKRAGLQRIDDSFDGAVPAPELNLGDRRSLDVYSTYSTDAETLPNMYAAYVPRANSFDEMNFTTQAPELDFGDGNRSSGDVLGGAGGGASGGTARVLPYGTRAPQVYRPDRADSFDFAEPAPELDFELSGTSSATEHTPQPPSAQAHVKFRKKRLKVAGAENAGVNPRARRSRTVESVYVEGQTVESLYVEGRRVSEETLLDEVFPIYEVVDDRRPKSSENLLDRAGTKGMRRFISAGEITMNVKTAIAFEPLEAFVPLHLRFPRVKPPVPQRRRKSSYMPEQVFVQAPASRVSRAWSPPCALSEEEGDDHGPDESVHRQEALAGGAGGAGGNSAPSANGAAVLRVPRQERQERSLAAYARKSLNLDAIEDIESLDIGALAAVQWSGTKEGNASKNEGVYVATNVVSVANPTPKTYDSVQAST